METNLSAVHFQFEWDAINSKHFAVSQISVLFLLRRHLHWLSRTFLHTIKAKVSQGENIWCLPCDFNLTSDYWNTANIPEKLVLSLLSDRTDDFAMLDHSHITAGWVSTQDFFCVCACFLCLGFGGFVFCNVSP